MRRIVLATDAAFFPPFQGDSARLLQLIQFLKRRGWGVHVVHFHDRQQRDVDYVEMSRLVDQLVVYFPSDDDLELRKSERLDDWCPERFALLVRSVCNSANADAVVAQFVFLSRCLSLIDASSGVCRILDADNIFAGRREKHAAAGVPYAWFSTTETEEREGWRRADLLMSVQEHELDVIRRTVPRRPVILVPYAQKVTDTGPGNGQSLLFVGADNEANVAGLQAFVAEALPELRRRHAAARLVIAGRAGERFRDTPGVEARGVVEDLGDCYSAAPIAINVMTCGTGLKTKTIEALCHGKCLVSTPAGVEGLEQYPEVYHVAETPRALGGIIGDLFDRPDEIERTRMAALWFARGYFAADVVFGRLETAIVNWLERNRPVE
ncbi:MAG: glycosyltransferase [Acidobacteriota bacterium]|nr:glycosyltransferase [Acidobacteriota bacterium]